MTRGRLFVAAMIMIGVLTGCSSESSDSSGETSKPSASAVETVATAIQKPWEPEQSPIREFLDVTDLPTLIGYSEHDDPPIPRAIQNMFRNTAQRNENVEYHTIEGIYHNFRRTQSDEAGNAVDNDAVKRFGNYLICFLQD